MWRMHHGRIKTRFQCVDTRPLQKKTSLPLSQSQMPLAAASLPPTRLLSYLSKTLGRVPVPLSSYALRRLSIRRSPLRPSIEHLALRSLHRRCPMSSSSSFSTVAAAAMTPSPVPSPSQVSSTRSKRKAHRVSPEALLHYHLNMCSKNGDVQEALRLYDAARAASTPLTYHHFNILLYLCSSSSDPVAIKRGFEIHRQMGLDAVAPNEATFTSLARLAAAKEDPDLAFDLVRQMSAAGIPPKLRSFGPALLGFCKKGDAEKAHAVENYMASCGVQPEEAELMALLGLNVDRGRGDDVYRLLHRMRVITRRVSEPTAEILERWFNSEAAAEVGIEEWDAHKVKEGVIKGGGGWHGEGWLGKGRWDVGMSEMDEKGACQRCGERLVCIDIDPVETDDFAKSVTQLACKKECKNDFMGFQDWLERHGPFDAVIDGANIGLNSHHSFNFSQLNSVVHGMRHMSPSGKLPLIILHTRRVKGGPAENPRNKKLLENWWRSGVLYATPPGSNDDWYWLYAAVSLKSLLVTNDEMRDHLFELLGTSFFPRWKEKHQVRLTFDKNGLSFHMPPPYSIVIQESEDGKWHIPTSSGDDTETRRKWVCATRNKPHHG